MSTTIQISIGAILGLGLVWAGFNLLLMEAYTRVLLLVAKKSHLLRQLTWFLLMILIGPVLVCPAILPLFEPSLSGTTEGFARTSKMLLALFLVNVPAVLYFFRKCVPRLALEGYYGSK